MWVSAYLRRVTVEGADGVLRRRGAAEAGAIFVLAERRDGRLALFAPAPADENWDGERRWRRAHAEDWIDVPEMETRLSRETRFDPDLWIVVVESRDGETWLPLAGD
jgi:hypothetical protein